jgi:hypothetical protein
MGRLMFRGAVCAIVGAFFAAPLVGLVYGFPIPFRGKVHGLEAVVPSVMAVVFFGLLGGFIALGIMGAAGGAVAHVVSRGEPARGQRLTAALGFLSSLAGVILVAVLDVLIGPR